MKVASFLYAKYNKYILYTKDDNGKPTLHYTLIIYKDIGSTELTVYTEGHVSQILKVNGVINVDVKNPLGMITKFNKLTLIQ